MIKCFITGSVASGKTTLAKKISEVYHIPYYELDQIIHAPDGTYRSQEECDVIFNNIDQQGDWILEGTYRDRAKIMLNKTTHCLMIDPPVSKRCYRLIKRWIKQRLGKETCHYKLTLKMLYKMFYWTYRYEKKKDMHIKRCSTYHFLYLRKIKKDILDDFLSS